MTIDKLLNELWDNIIIILSFKFKLISIIKLTLDLT